jgi:hypothetical protein
MIVNTMASDVHFEPDHRNACRAAVPPLPGRWYPTLVVALAVFFFGLVAWRVPVTGYRVRADVGVHRDAHEAASDPKTPTAEPTWLDEPAAARQVLANAVRYAEARRTGREPDPQESVSESLLQQIRDALSVSSDTLPDGRTAVRIRFTGNDPVWALAFVEYLTRDCLLATDRPARRGPNAARQIRIARWRLELAQHYERKAQCGLEHLTPVVPENENVSTQWSAVPVSHQTTDAAPSALRVVRQREYDDAVQNRETAERELAAAVAGPTATAEVSSVDRRWLITPPTVEGRIGGRPSAGRVGLIGLMALLTAAVVGAWLGRLRALQRINTLADLEAALPVPVVGQLSLDPMSRHLLRVTRGRLLVNVVTAGGELTLAVLIITFLLGIIGDTATSAWLREDPLAAIAETIGRVWQRWL